jgi:stage II sporulation protein D
MEVIMKRMLRLGLVILGIMIITPVFAVIIFRERLPQNDVSVQPALAVSETAYTAPAVVRMKSGEEISMRDFVIGAVFAEMPADFPEEAIKTQALAVFTSTIRETVKHADDPYDIDENFYIRYFTEGMARVFYTDGYDKAYAKISSAVDEILGFVIVYEDEPIAAPSFSAFTGVTETVVGVPYLTSVESPGDVYSPDYIKTESFTAAEISARFITEIGATLGGEPDGFFEIIDISPAGSVLTIRAGKEVISGAEFAEILNLRSVAFSIKYNNTTERIDITTTGSGDGIGLSKYGAKYMAENGSDYREITLHYFSGVKLSEILIKS